MLESKNRKEVKFFLLFYLFIYLYKADKDIQEKLYNFHFGYKYIMICWAKTYILFSTNFVMFFVITFQAAVVQGS